MESRVPDWGGEEFSTAWREDSFFTLSRSIISHPSIVIGSADDVSLYIVQMGTEVDVVSRRRRGQVGRERRRRRRRRQQRGTSGIERYSPSGLTLFLLPSMGECVLEAGRCMRGEFLRCATAADISVDDEIGGPGRSVQGTCAQESKNRRACVHHRIDLQAEESRVGFGVGLR